MSVKLWIYDSPDNLSCQNVSFICFTDSIYSLCLAIFLQRQVVFLLLDWLASKSREHNLSSCLTHRWISQVDVTNPTAIRTRLTDLSPLTYSLYTDRLFTPTNIINLVYFRLAQGHVRFTSHCQNESNNSWSIAKSKDLLSLRSTRQSRTRNKLLFCNRRQQSQPHPLCITSRMVQGMSTGEICQLEDFSCRYRWEGSREP